LKKGRDKLRTVKIVQHGVGPVDAEAVKYGLKKQGIGFVDAIDIDPNKVGKDLRNDGFRRVVSWSEEFHQSEAMKPCQNLNF